jgi:hypothetical protein
LEKKRPESRFCLLELPTDELEALEAGGKILFKAQSGPEGFMSLCGESKTYGVEFLENSNSLFVGSVELPEEAAAGASEGAAADSAAGEKPTPKLGKCNIFAQVAGQLVVKQANPDAQRVRELLLPTALGQDVAAKAQAQPGMSLSAIAYESAGSKAELEKLLIEGPYVEVDGVWRYLPPVLEREITDAAVSIVTALGWSEEAVDVEALLREVRQHLGDAGEASVPGSAVLRKAVRGVLAPKPEATDAAPAAEDAAVLALDKEKMSRFRALQLLQDSPAQVRSRFQLRAEPRAKRPRTVAGGGGTSLGPALLVSEFVAAYQALTGSEATEEEVLKIVADRVYVDELEGTIHSIDDTSLPQDPMGRLARLFDLQTHWRPERLAPLVAPSLGKEQKVAVWLMTNSRAVFVEREPGGTEQRMLTRKFAIAGM